MKRKLYGKRRYYNDETKDDFGHDFNKSRPVVVGPYRYMSRNRLFRIGQWCILHLLAKPIFWLYGKLALRIRVEGRANIRALRRLRTGAVVYGNHVHELDAVFYYAYTARGTPHIVVSPGAVKIPFVNKLLPLFGVLPVPEDLEAYRGFNRAIDTILARGSQLYVLPEAHLWPLYAGVRHFSDTSFRYAARNRVPAVPMAITFRRRRGKNGARKTPRITLHVGEPIDPDPSLPVRESARALRDAVYAWIAARADAPDNFAVVDYVKTDVPVRMRDQLELNRRGVEYTP